MAVLHFFLVNSSLYILFSMLQGLLRSTKCLCMSSSNLKYQMSSSYSFLPLSSKSHNSALFLFSSLPYHLILIPTPLFFWSLHSLLILIPPLSSYSDPSILFLFSSLPCLLILIPLFSSYSHPSPVFLFWSLYSLLILIPPLSSYSHPTILFLFSSSNSDPSIIFFFLSLPPLLIRSSLHSLLFLIPLLSSNYHPSPLF